MLGLLQQYPTNLRTIIVFCAVLLLPMTSAMAQHTLNGHTALSETDGLDAPLAAIRPELAVEVVPVPYGHASLSRARIAHGWPQEKCSIAWEAQGAPGLLQTRIGARTMWSPQDSYHVVGHLTAQWMALAAFPDQWSLDLDVAAQMTLAGWSIRAGLFDAMVWGRTPRPAMLIGISTAFATGSAGVELSSRWVTSPLVSLSTQLVLADYVTTGIRIGASPITVDIAIRIPAGKETAIVLAVRQRERLGIQPRVTLCWRSPSLWQ